ncbi:MIF4G domain containing protein [Nitzschia inconspicua]|uniref:MIF4G domain containing protein n=1 Tax=Nitzschia inconspicua TaxID=303405 RepID=A0A9K3PFM7_9STRA|nr:MIF4G domain containing protein [Nitzschia inconspicua]
MSDNNNNNNNYSTNRNNHNGGRGRGGPPPQPPSQVGGGNPYVMPPNAGRGNMGAWQPTAPTSLQMAANTAQGVQQQPPQQQQPTPQYAPQQQQQQQQQQPQGYPTGMNPYATYNPYAAASYGMMGNPNVPHQRGGWTPSYPTGAGGNPYAATQGMYYNPAAAGAGAAAAGGPGGVRPGAAGGTTIPGQPGVASTVQPPAPRVRKALVITDKSGKPIELPNSKPGTSATTAVAATTATTTTTSPPAAKPPSSDAGEKLKQAALAAIQAKDEKKKREQEEKDEAAAKKQLEQQQKEEEEEKTAAAAAAAEAAAKAKQEKEDADAKKAAAAAAAAAAKPAPKSSLASLLSKQEEKEEDDLSMAMAATSISAETTAATTAPTTVSEESAPEPTPVLTPTNGGPRRFVFSKNELLRLKELPVCTQRPADLPEFVITREPSKRPGGDDSRRDRRGSQPRGGGGGGGGGGDWQRGAAPPNRNRSQQQSTQRGTNNEDAPWSRGQAPPPRAPVSGGRGGGGRGGGRGGRGGQQQQQGPFFDGPVAPLVKSKDGWRPRKDKSEFVVAEKKVKGILNKMTKEKFDRLSAQMAEIPITSHGILKMLIENVYEKAIDEPTFGDMYGDLCVKLSQNVQSTSFVKIIESDEEPPTDDGEPAPPSTSGEAASSYSVYRWSNDVNTSDSEILGPYSSPEECLETALSSEEQPPPIQRGDLELELVKLQIKNGVFIKIMKKKTKKDDGEAEDGQVEEAEEYYTVFFPVADHEECGQQLSKIFLTDRECMSDANKSNSFKRLLLNKCEDEFNKQDIYVDWKKEKAEYEQKKGTMSPSEQAETEEELDFRRIKIKKQMLGNIKFIGQLYKKNLLKEKIMRFCIGSLLKLETKEPSAKLPKYFDTGDMDMDEEDHEAICSMFTTIGKTIDRPPAADYMKVCFDKIKRMSTDKSLPSRSRFMYKDLLELRENNWTPRREEAKAKTLEEIRQDFERDEARQAQQSAQLNQSYRGGGGSSGDYRNQSRQQQSYNTSGRPRQPGRSSVQTDDDGFTTVGGATGGPVKPRGGFSLSQAASSSPSKILQKPKQGFTALADDGKARPAPLDNDKFERRVKVILSEYMQDPTNTKELFLAVDELTGTDNYGTMLVAKCADNIIDCKDSERKATYEMLGILVEQKKLTPNDVKAGLVDMIEFIDAYESDAPRAFEYLGDFLATMIRTGAINVSWVGEQAEKSKASKDSNPEKIIRALISSIKNDKRGGPEAVKAAFGPHQKAMESLLGSSTWIEIKKQV